MGTALNHKDEYKDGVHSDPRDSAFTQAVFEVTSRHGGKEAHNAALSNMARNEDQAPRTEYDKEKKEKKEECSIAQALLNAQGINSLIGQLTKELSDAQKQYEQSLKEHFENNETLGEELTALDNRILGEIDHIVSAQLPGALLASSFIEQEALPDNYAGDIYIIDDNNQLVKADQDDLAAYKAENGEDVMFARLNNGAIVCLSTAQAQERTTKLNQVVDSIMNSYDQVDALAANVKTLETQLTEAEQLQAELQQNSAAAAAPRTVAAYKDYDDLQDPDTADTPSLSSTFSAQVTPEAPTPVNDPAYTPDQQQYTVSSMAVGA